MLYFNPEESTSLEYRIRRRIHFMRDINGTKYTATIPTKLSTASLDSFGDNKSYFYGIKSEWSVKMPQPMVTVNCVSMPSHRLDANTTVPYIRDDGSHALSLKLHELLRLAKITDVSNNIVYATQNDTVPDFSPPVWMPSPELGSSSLLGIFIKTQSDSAPTDKGLPSIDIHGTRNTTLTEFIRINNLTVEICTLQSYWQPAVASLYAWNGQVASLVVETDICQHWETTSKASAEPIKIHLAKDSSLKTPAFSRQLYDGLDRSSPTAMKLSGLFAIAVSSVPATEHYTAKVDGYETPFHYTQTVEAYSYCHSTTSDLLSAIVITAYCAITAAYIIYTIFTGAVSTAWNSPIDFVMLALQFRRVSDLGNTSVGIDSPCTFRESVGIRVNDNDSLELVFTRDKATRSLRKIQRNKEY